MHPEGENGLLPRDHIVENNAITKEAPEVGYGVATKQSMVSEVKGVEEQTPFDRHVGRTTKCYLNSWIRFVTHWPVFKHENIEVSIVNHMRAGILFDFILNCSSGFIGMWSKSERAKQCARCPELDSVL